VPPLQSLDLFTTTVFLFFPCLSDSESLFLPGKKSRFLHTARILPGPLEDLRCIILGGLALSPLSGTFPASAEAET